MRAKRGSALLVVLLVLVAVMLLAAAIIGVSTQRLGEARNREHTEALADCAQAVRNYLASAVTGGGSMSNLSFTLPGTTNPITLKGGHYDNINVSSFSLPAAPAFGAQSGPPVEQLSNGLPITVGLPPVIHTGTAVCTDENGRTYEVEFSFMNST